MRLWPSRKGVSRPISPNVAYNTLYTHTQTVVLTYISLESRVQFHCGGSWDGGGLTKRESGGQAAQGSLQSVCEAQRDSTEIVARLKP